METLAGWLAFTIKTPTSISHPRPYPFCLKILTPHHMQIVQKKKKKAQPHVACILTILLLLSYRLSLCSQQGHQALSVE